MRKKTRVSLEFYPTVLDTQWYAMFSSKSLKSIKITNGAYINRYFSFFLQAQRLTLEHTEVSEEPAEGVQVWWPEGHSSLVTKRLEPHRSQEIKGRHGCSAGEFNNNGNNRSSPRSYYFSQSSSNQSPNWLNVSKISRSISSIRLYYN